MSSIISLPFFGQRLALPLCNATTYMQIEVARSNSKRYVTEFYQCADEARFCLVERRTEPQGFFSPLFSGKLRLEP
jgi:hypothetical protein